MEHITIYREPGRYAGWPANYGIWAWGDEIVVGFTAGYHDPAGGFHCCDRNRPFVAMQARSLDGGRSWDVGPTPCRTPGGRGLSADEHVQPELWTLAAIEQGLADAPAPCPGWRGFHAPRLRPDVRPHGAEGRRPLLVLHLHRPLPQLAGAVQPADVRLHRDRGPHRLPGFRAEHLHPLPDRGQSGRRGRPHLLRPHDRWRQDVRSVVPHRPGAVRLRHHARQPAPEPDAHPLRRALLRAPHRVHHPRHWIDLYASDDDGATWRFSLVPCPTPAPAATRRR